MESRPVSWSDISGKINRILQVQVDFLICSWEESHQSALIDVIIVRYAA